MILNPYQYFTSQWQEGQLASLLFGKPEKPKPHYVVHKGVKLTPEEYDRMSDIRSCILEALQDGAKSAKVLAYETGFADKSVYTHLATMVQEGVLVKQSRMYKLKEDVCVE